MQNVANKEPELRAWIAELWLPPESTRRTALRERWPELRAPLHEIEPSEFISLFRSVGYVTDDETLSANPTTIYRGAPIVDSGRGISWSATGEIARKYANDYRTTGATALWRATCSPEAVLGRFQLDDEVVVDPNLLVDVTQVASATFAARPVVRIALLGGQTLGSDLPGL